MIRRREFIRALGGAAAWPLAAHAQQQMPVVGFLNGGSAWEYGPQAAAFRRGLNETGYVEGRNLALEYRWAHNEPERLPELAADLVHRRMAVIAALGSTPAAVAAKTATSTIPIVFASGGDPVRYGLVASLNRPGGNVTGLTDMANDLLPKLLRLMQELAPQAIRFGVLVNPFDHRRSAAGGFVHQSSCGGPHSQQQWRHRRGFCRSRPEADRCARDRTRYAFHQPRFPTCYAGHIPSSSRKLLVARISASRRVDELRSERDRP